MTYGTYLLTIVHNTAIHLELTTHFPAAAFLIYKTCTVNVLFR
jgi:hypothetical protein